MQIENATSNENAYIEVSDYHKNNHSKWQFSYVGEGYYYIQSAHSGKYLTVSNNSLADGAPIIQTSVVSDSCQWKISVSSDGQYVFTPKSDGTESMALSLESQQTVAGVNLAQKTYIDDDNDMDEWFIYYDASFLGLLHRDTGTRDAFIEPCKNIFDDCETLGKYSSDYPQQEMGNIMENSKIFVIHTHGNQTGFLIQDHKPFETDDAFYMENIQQLDLSQVKLIIFLTCEGGLGGYSQENVDNGTPTNLVEACVASGAETVIAFSDITHIGNCNVWIEAFFGIMNEGKTVTEAIEVISNPSDENEGETGTDVIEEPSTTLGNYRMLSTIAVVGGNAELKLSDIFS